jgi:CheY-like chemotaxis protein
MQDPQTRILIVDDQELIRISLSQALAELGYRVSSAADGFAALREMRREVPEILLSDLNMPGMSGFELLTVVRFRFPAIQVIAMSGSFSGREVPSGLAADGFYGKGCGIAALLKVIQSMPSQKRPLPKHPEVLTPVLVQAYGYDAAGNDYATIVCPECLRSFYQTLDCLSSEVQKADCIYCGTSIQYAIVQRVNGTPMEMFQHIAAERILKPARTVQYCF